MKIARLIIGIISILLSVVIVLQSTIAGAVNLLAGNGELGGAAGAFLAICVFIAGVLGICFRKRRKGCVVAGLLYFIGGIFAVMNFGWYVDLRLWAIISLTFGLIFWLTAIWQNGDPLY